VNQEESHTPQKAVLIAEKLRDILRAETVALRSFEKERLLEIIAEKEELARELAQQMEDLAFSGSPAKRPDQGPSLRSGASEAAQAGTEEGCTSHTVLKELLREIVECNQKNRAFIEGSLGYWQELLTALLPSTYVCSHLGQAGRQSIPAKGLALNREV